MNIVEQDTFGLQAVLFAWQQNKSGPYGVASVSTLNTLSHLLNEKPTDVPSVATKPPDDIRHMGAHVRKNFVAILHVQNHYITLRYNEHKDELLVHDSWGTDAYVQILRDFLKANQKVHHPRSIRVVRKCIQKNDTVCGIIAAMAAVCMADNTLDDGIHITPGDLRAAGNALQGLGGVSDDGNKARRMASLHALAAYMEETGHQEYPCA